MGRYLGAWPLEAIINVPVQTSSVTTGAAADAESVPTWRMYEDTTATPVTTGSFASLNAQTGLYIATITLAAAIGYERGKSYSLRVQATVSGVIGADVHGLQIEPSVALLAGAITAGTITDGALTASKFGAGFITAGSFSGNALANMPVTLNSTSNAAIAAAVTAGSIGPVTLNSTSNAAIAAAITAGSIGPVTLGATSAAAVAVKVWDEPKSSHGTADTFGEYLDATISGISGGSADTTLSPTAQSALIDGIWGATRAAHSTAGTFGEGIASVQGNITGSVASVTNGVTVGATAQAAIVDGVWDEAKSGHTTADTYGEYLDSTTGAIKSDTSAIKSQTDTLTFTTSNSIKADIKFVNGVSVTGNGQSGTEWGPGS